MEDINVCYYKKLYVSKSQINENGLFTSEFIKTGEKILSFGGILVPTSERYSGKYLSSTFVGITEKIALCEGIDSTKDYSDYINHSCNPNAGMYDCITVIAKKDILPDEEICCDYAYWEANEEWKLKSLCSCGAPCCRGTITGMDWRKMKSTDADFKFYSPFLKRRIIDYEQGL